MIVQRFCQSRKTVYIILFYILSLHVWHKIHINMKIRCESVVYCWCILILFFQCHYRKRYRRRKIYRGVANKKKEVTGLLYLLQVYSVCIAYLHKYCIHTMLISTKKINVFQYNYFFQQNSVIFTFLVSCLIF